MTPLKQINIFLNSEKPADTDTVNVLPLLSPTLEEMDDDEHLNIKQI